MFVYGVCVGPSGLFDTVLAPSLRARGLGPLLERRDQRSIFDAYRSITDEAIERWPELEGVVLLHDDVAIEDDDFETKLRAVLADPEVGLVGAIGGRRHRAMSWWEDAQRFGAVREPTESERWTAGTNIVDTADGLLLVLSPWAVRALPWKRLGYPGWHGYDSEACAAVRAAGKKVVVTDLAVRHECKPVVTDTPAYRQALYQYLLRWRPAPAWRRMVWHSRRYLSSLRAVG